MQHDGALGVAPPGELVGQAGLAGARLAGDEDDMAASGHRPGPRPFEHAPGFGTFHVREGLGAPERQRQRDFDSA